MCDSHIIFFPVEHINTDAVPNHVWPGHRHQTVNHFGEVFSGRGQVLDGVSPLTRGQFKIRPEFKHHPNQTPQLIGYEVSINTPACVVGNNALMDNLVYPSLVASRYLLHYNLLKRGCDPRLVKKILLKGAKLRSVTFTYLVPFDDFEQATSANAAMEDISESHINAKQPEHSIEAPAKSVTSRGSTSVEMKFGRKYEITSYVKKGRTKFSYNQFADQEVEKAIFAESSRHLRVEIMLKTTYLKNYKDEESNNLDLTDPMVWKSGKTASSAYKNGISIIRRELGLDGNLRLRRPQPSHMKKLSKAESKVATWHLDGHDYRKHPFFAHSSKQYASKVKRSIEKKLKIDMSVPWRKSHKSTALLAKHLIWRGAFTPPDHLADHCFVRSTVSERLSQLKAEIEKLAQR